MTAGYPSIAAAETELQLAGTLNPGPWVKHSMNTGLAARYIAERCDSLDPEKAYVLGLLHDIGRRAGIFAQRHIIEGYKYCTDRGWDEAAKICMTHSFMIQDINAIIGDWDVTQEDFEFMKHYIETVEYDDYDRLFQLCDGLALADGFCLLEKRLIDIHRRYGVNEYVVPRWNSLFDSKDYFERKIGCSIYEILPGVRETTFQDFPLWKPNK